MAIGSKLVSFKTAVNWRQVQHEEPFHRRRNVFLQMSVVLIAGVSLEFGQSSVYPELCARLHRIVFVVVSASQKQERRLNLDRKKALVSPLKCDMKRTNIRGIKCLYSPTQALSQVQFYLYSTNSQQE